jgi:hypothetical protein
LAAGGGIVEEENKQEYEHDETPAHRVHVIFKTHLDVGFTDFARNVVRNYMERYIPAALALAREMRDGTDGARFLWTTGSWLIYEYLEQADAAGRRAMEEGILAGDIAWHALPFTTHTELMDESLFRFGLSLSGELDARFGRKTIAAKMTDVPGHTIGMVPLLAEAGVRFLHIGVNPACRPPQVPDVFRWRHPGGDEVVVMYHKGSYGSTMRVPGMTDAIAFAHTGDNCGPQSAEQIRIAFAHLRADFPGAEVAASTLDAYARALLEIADTLPVVDQEIGDTWIHGVGTDPRKVVLFRQLSRLRRHLLDEGTYTGEEADFKAFSRALLMIPEHTWGLDEKTYLGDYVNYSRPDFEAARKKDVVTAPIPPESPAWGKFRKKDPKPRYSYFESSWHEQRRYLVDAMDALPATLSEVLDEAVAAVLPAPVDRTGFAPASPGYRAVTNFFIRFDAATGALNLLNDKRNDVTWADKRHPWGLVRYQTFSQADYDRYLAQYTINMEHTWVSDWAVPDLSKPGMAATGAESRMWLPALQEFLWRRAPEADDFLAVLAMPEEAVTRYGAPATVEVLYRFPHDAPAVLVEVHWSDKAANRLPEALWCTFHPVAPIADGWVLDKMGTAVNPRDVVRYGNRRLHSVDNDVRYRDSLGGIDLFTPDAPLVAPGAPGLLDFAQTQPDPKHGMHVNLYNNVWGTNFPMWHDEDALFRFLVVVAAAEDA